MRETPFDRVLINVQQAQRDLDLTIIEEVRKEERAALRLQADQMFAGQRGDGQEIRPPYAATTVQIKRRRRQPTDRVTLRDQGDFQDSLIIEYGPDSFQYNATDFKRPYLTRKYGEEIFGLNDDNLQKLIDLLRDSITTRLQEMILRNA